MSKQPLSRTNVGGVIANRPSLGSVMVYNDYVRHYIALENDPLFLEQSNLVQSIIKEFTNHRKIIGSFNLACEVIKASYSVPVSEEDVVWAYAIGAGGGCEYEFPFE